MGSRTIGIILIIIGLVIFGPMALASLVGLAFRGFGLGVYSFLLFVPVIITAGLVLTLIKLVSKNKEANQKTYKSENTLRFMKIQYLFYIVGVIFIFISVWYFAREYIAQFPRIIKLVLLLVSIVVTYVAAELMRGSDI